MKRQILLLAGICLAMSGWAQNDTTGRNSPPISTSDSLLKRNDSIPKKPAGPLPNDTIRVGGLIIVKNRNGIDDESGLIRIRRRKAEKDNYKQSNISTNWLIFDIGFANYNDRTNYSSLQAQQFAPGANAGWFNLRTGKSVDVNIWLFMQKMNLVKHVINFKYGLGIELNNYRYTQNIRFLTNPTRVIMDTINYTKNKLAVDYVTVPLMLNFNLTPGKKNNSFGISGGVSFGYKYSSRQKFKSSETGKEKTFNDFELNPFKISYIGEVQLGPVKLYGSYATQSMFKKGLDQTPYTVGLRFSNW